MDILEGENTNGHYDGIYGAYMQLQRMIRKDGFKLILCPKIQQVLLYDLVGDPNEMKDLAGNPDYKEKVRQLFDELIALQKDMGDTLDLKDVYHEVVGKPE